MIEDVTISTSSPVINLGEISMVPSTLDMPDVEYQVEGNEVMLSADRKVYRLSKNIADAGGSVADALEEIPSVSVDIEGNVSLRGSENVRILIDGKPSSRIGMNAAEALQQLPAEMIEQVEVMTNPSAKYDAQGDAGIINLVLKKQRKKGLNGSTSANVGYPARYGVGINLNYRVGKFNLFFDDNARVRSHTGEGETRQTFYDGNPYAPSTRHKTGIVVDGAIVYE